MPSAAEDDEIFGVDDTEVVEPVAPRTITSADRLAKAASIAKNVAEEARDRAEKELVSVKAEFKACLDHVDSLLAQRAELRGDVEALWFTLGAVLSLFDGREHMTAKQQHQLHAARDLHKMWSMETTSVDKPAPVEDPSSTTGPAG